MRKGLLAVVLVVLLLLPMNVVAAETKEKEAENTLIATVVFANNAINIVPNLPTIDQDILSIISMQYTTNEEIITSWVRLYVTNHFNAYAEKRSWLLVTYNANYVCLYIFKGDQSLANMLAYINSNIYEKVSYGHFVENVGILENKETAGTTLPTVPNIPENWQVTPNITEFPDFDEFLKNALKDGENSYYVYSYSSECGQTWEKSPNKEYYTEYAQEDYYWAMW